MEFKGVNYYLGRGNEMQSDNNYMSSQNINNTSNFNVNFNFSNIIDSNLINSLKEIIMDLEVHKEPMLKQAISFDN